VLLAVRAGEKNAGLRAGRPDDDPPLRPAVVGQRRRILDEVESQCAGEEPDGRVVIIDNDRELLDPHEQQARPATRRPAVMTSASSPRK